MPLPSKPARIVVGTRSSPLAQRQAAYVVDRLAAAGFDVAVVDVTTWGDRILDVPLAGIGGKGLFTKELDVALLEGRIDLAVHSLKDLPTRLPDGLVLAAVAERAEPWDAFVAGPGMAGMLHDLPPGARLGTSSLRRAAQLRAWRSDIQVVPVRGNVGTRLEKLEQQDWEGLVLAEAGLRRLGLGHLVRERFSPEVMLPAVGQGAVAVVAAGASVAVVEALRTWVEHGPSRAAAVAERAFLARLEGGCQVPIGAYAEPAPGGRLTLEGCVASLDGRTVLRERAEGDREAAEALGAGLAERLRARGADRLLARVRAAAAPAAAGGYVLLLRMLRDSDPYVAAFEAAGYEVQCLPLLAYEFIDDGALVAALARAEAYAGMVLTSPRALDAIAASDAARAEVHARWAGKPAFTVGPETAERARALGLSVRGEETGTGSGLAAFVSAEIGRNAQNRLLFPAGRPRRGELIQGLAEHRIDVDEVVVYTARPRADLQRPLGPLPGWVVFFSPRGVELAAEALALPWERVRKAAIGPITARALRERGWAAEAVAEAPTPGALVAAVARSAP